MEIAIKEVGKASVNVQCPKSRSFTNRALVISALATGESVLKNTLVSDDTSVMIDGLRSMGIAIEQDGRNVKVVGCGGKLLYQGKEIFTGNSGTTMRFLFAVASLSSRKIKLTGDKRMTERPIGELCNALANLGVSALTTKGYPPVEIKGPLSGGVTSLNGEISSQFVSGILMAAPYAKKEVKVNIIGELASKPYVDATIACMADFGCAVKNDFYKSFSVSNTKQYSGSDYFVEGDFSNASYFFAAAAITKIKVRVSSINPHSVQGEKKFLNALENMGCEVSNGKDWIEVKGNELNGIDLDMNSMPDAAQTMAVVALFAKGKTRISNIANLRIKETDRISAMVTELRKLGAKIIEFDDGLEISPSSLRPAKIDTYNDHRMAMSFGIAGLAIKGVVIKNPECVSKTFPGFFSELERFY